MTNIAAPEVSGLKFASMTLIVWSSIALFFLLLSWAVGGTEYKDAIYGNSAFVVILLGLIAGIGLNFASRNKA